MTGGARIQKPPCRPSALLKSIYAFAMHELPSLNTFWLFLICGVLLLVVPKLFDFLDKMQNRKLKK